MEEKRKYYSKRYLTEKWENLKFYMEKVLLQNEDDKIPQESVDRVKRAMTFYMECIMKEINK